MTMKDQKKKMIAELKDKIMEDAQRDQLDVSEDDLTTLVVRS